MKNLLFVVLFIFVSIVAYGDKVPVCVQADTNSDGFVKSELADPVKDVQKQVKKSKKLKLDCKSPSLTIVIMERGVRATGDTSYSHGVISKITRRFMVGKLVLLDGREAQIIQRDEGMIQHSWGHLAKKLREQVEDFIEMNDVK